MVCDHGESPLAGGRAPIGARAPPAIRRPVFLRRIGSWQPVADLGFIALTLPLLALIVLLARGMER